MNDDSAENNHDILTLEDIKMLVDTFYSRVAHNELLGPVFKARIGDNWQPHLEKMYTFWQTVLLEEYTYFGRPFPPHAQLPVDAEHFNEWLALFTQAIDELFIGDKATEAKWRAGKMAQMFMHKIAYLRSNPLNIH
ncbi:group III truncated hemoglobin [Mucilaginibacter sp. Bleaf8]|uniref:group III truncated hemoglobin n=1 Tax=Mucilaginibacter sp. Bleaf8 TaxID=2834430 RepID=UPI001BCDEBF7|nr:group III truncated hemoglobin [Mucilaginibacter sp. Bleaf8]MBS7565024.1 group III truncated hemoglobin [Mucilaginibacter sp. Bleaf8]